MKQGVYVFTIIGLIGSFIASLFGGWDNAMTTLFIFMGIAYVSGIIVAGVFHTSPKTKHGSLDSKTGWKGLCKKGMILIFVLIGHRLDIMLVTDYIRNAVIIGFCANELISIIENAGLMRVPIPSIITNAIEVLKDKSKKEVK